MRKICYLSYYIFPTVQGGAPLYTYRLASHFSKKDWRVVVISRKPSGSSCETTISNIVVKELDDLTFTRTGFYRVIDKNLLFPLVAFKEVAKEWKDADILHIVSSSLFLPAGYIAKKALDTSVVVSLIEDVWNRPSGRLIFEPYFRFQRLQLRMALQFSDAILVHSDHAFQQIKKEDTSNFHKVTKIYQGVDPSFLRDVDAEEPQYHGLQNEPIVLSAGSLTRGKNIETVIRAVRKVLSKGFKVKLVVAGDGPHKHRLKRLVSQLKLTDSVAFIGQVKHQMMPALCRTAHVLVQSSKSEGGQPAFSVLEFLASGRPVIVSEACDRFNILGDCVLRFKPDDEDELSKQIIGVLVDKELRETLGRRAVELVRERFSLQSFFNQVEAVYERIC